MFDLIGMIIINIITIVCKKEYPITNTKFVLFANSSSITVIIKRPANKQSRTILDNNENLLGFFILPFLIV